MIAGVSSPIETPDSMLRSIKNRQQWQTLLADSTAHAMHDGIGYILLPIWQSQFGLS